MAYLFCVCHAFQLEICSSRPLVLHKIQINKLQRSLQLTVPHFFFLEFDANQDFDSGPVIVSVVSYITFISPSSFNKAFMNVVLSLLYSCTKE